MFSEIYAGVEAEGLQKVLLAAIEWDNDAVLDFCKEHVYPLYSSAIGESFSTRLTESKEHNKIEMEFNFGGMKL